MRRHRVWIIGAAGLLAGVATIFKQVAGMAWAAGMVFLAWDALMATGSKLKSVGWAACFTLGFAAPLVLLGLYFQQHDCLEDFLFWTLTYVTTYLKTSHQRLNFAIQFGACFLPFALACAVLWLAAGRWFITRLARWRRRSSASDQAGPAVLLAAWTIVSVAATLTGQRMYPHYFLQYLPSLCLVAGWASWNGRGFARCTAWRRAVVLGSILPALGSLLWAVFYVAETPPALGAARPGLSPRG